jgi:hypothetical protein
VREEVFSRLVELANKTNKTINDVIMDLLESSAQKPAPCLEGFRCLGKRLGSMIILGCVDEKGRVKQAVIPAKSLNSFIERLGEAVIIE